MAVDSVSLLAQNLYTKIQEQPKQNIDISDAKEASTFHVNVEKQFNSFARMSPAEILSHIQKNQQISNSKAPSGVEGTFLGALRSPLQKQEQITRKSLINEASLLDVLTATTEAKNTLDVMVKTRDKFLEAFDKVMSMSI